jgi:hypothetical protein
MKKIRILFLLQVSINLDIVRFRADTTYFEGRKVHSKITKFGRSKEKRLDCKMVVLALVINPQAFIKYSGIFQTESV